MIQKSLNYQSHNASSALAGCCCCFHWTTAAPTLTRSSPPSLLILPGGHTMTQFSVRGALPACLPPLLSWHWKQPQVFGAKTNSTGRHVDGGIAGHASEWRRRPTKIPLTKDRQRAWRGLLVRPLLLLLPFLLLLLYLTHQCWLLGMRNQFGGGAGGGCYVIAF